MERLERFYKIHQLLTERRLASFSVLQASLGVSRATLKRDIEYMRSSFNALTSGFTSRQDNLQRSRLSRLTT